MSRIRKYYYHNIYSIGDNDWNPIISKGISYKINKDYKEELMSSF